MFKALGIVLMAEVWMVTGHIFLKKGSDAIDPDSAWDRQWVVSLCRLPAIWLGICFLLIGLFFWYLALSMGDLSVTYSFGSLQYVVALVASSIFLKEKIDKNKIIGTLFVMGGVILMAMTAKGDF